MSRASPRPPLPVTRASTTATPKRSWPSPRAYAGPMRTPCFARARRGAPSRPSPSWNGAPASPWSPRTRPASGPRSAPSVSGRPSKASAVCYKTSPREVPASSAPAGHRQRVTGDVAGLVGGQEEHGVSDLQRVAEPLQRRHVVGAVLDRLVQLPEPGAEALGIDGAG